ncbi:hypothetical protein FACS189452_08000 [Bacteroidia bacterium]|nr:hypothetical protein FACS189452_08000 [Bacteroidia bacterium]GHT80514.1 hypothetical protein FACS189467_2860 [Bacteroidia bacterium]
MSYKLEFTDDADEHLQAHIKAGNKQLLTKIYSLFEELQEHPQTGTGKPKLLKYKSAGVWSRRINDKHRLLYKIENETLTVFVISLWGHYDDK